MQSNTASSSSRIASLDQFRGYTVAGMLFVNFGGGFAALHPVFKHHNTYCSYADTIMPQFFFAVGFALRFVLLRNREKLGVGPAYVRALRRVALLIALGLVLYNLNWDYLSIESFTDPKLRSFAAMSFWRDTFQTLVHIGVTCLWVLPVVAAPRPVRVAFGAASGLLHLGLSWLFWYEMLHAKKVIDGGPLGFLTWTVPVIAGTVAYDWWRARGPAGSLRPLLAWGAGLMVLGYGLSCLGKGGPLAAPPFWPPSGPVDLWTMSQRAGSLSYQTFAAGLSLALYAAFVWACDLRGLGLGLFSVFGQNALAAYILHSLLDVPFSLLKHKEAPLWQAVGVIALFLVANALVVAWLNRRGWFLRL